jgi:hypothetical protein
MAWQQGLLPRCQLKKKSAAKPKHTEHNPKNRICPSLISSKEANMRRQPAGEANGNRPSRMSTKARASHKVSDIKRARPLCHLPDEETLLLRRALKKSEEGSTTITSLLLAKLDL